MSDVSDNDNVNEKTQMPLAIVGIGSMFPRAGDLERFWSNIKQGVDAITEVPETHWSPEDYFDEDQKRADHTYGRRGGFLEPYAFDPMKYGIPPMSIEATDTSQLLGMVVAESAMEDAGYGLDKDFDRSKVSVILGVTGALEMVIPLGARLGHPQWRKALKAAGVDDATADDAIQRMSDSYVDWQENSFPGLLGNVVAGRISKYLNTGGTNCVVDAACASSLSALHMAALELEAGKADMVITGGTDTFNDIFMYMCFSKTPALSPTGNAKPFDANCDGTILGEGLGMVVLKRLSDAERDGDTIYAIVKGVGSSSDGKGDAIYAPSSPGQINALEAAYKASGVSPDTIELLEAHGTGTMKGDAVEAAALAEVYSDDSGRASWCALGSVKSQIGHTKSAAGVAGLIKAALSLHNKVLPPTIKVEQPAEAVAPGSTPFYVNTTQRPWVENANNPRRAAVSAFGFGGSNFHMVMEEYSPKKSTVDWDGLTQIIAFCGDNFSDIQGQLDSIADDLDWNSIRILAKESRGHFDVSKESRLLLVLEEATFDIAKLKETIATNVEKQGIESSWSTQDVFYGSGKASGKLGYIFPGQGAQYTGMLRELACQFPEFLEALNIANNVYGTDESGQRLSDLIYPHPTFDKEAASRNTEALTNTDVAQPAIGTVSLGAMEILKRFGLKPEAAAGHSYGELCALCAGGVLTGEAMVEVSKLRGALMASGDGDRGTMLAVRGNIDATQAVIDEEKLDVILANKNSPSQAVLSGSTEGIKHAKSVLDEKKIKSIPLTVAAAFHSSLVADAAVPFGEGLEKIEIGSATIPVYSNTTGGEYPTDFADIRSLLANQLAKPVEFVAEITAMSDAGVTTFIEVGPGARMTGLVKQILKDREIDAYALDASNGKKSGIADLGKMLAQTAALGYGIDFAQWDDAFEMPEEDAGKKPKLLVDICGANYRSEQSLKRMDKPASAPKAVAPVTAPTPTRRKTAEASRVNRPPVAVAPTTPPVSAVPADAGAIANLLQQTQANIAALQQMQQQTAQLHAQFLQGQEQAGKTFSALMQQQQQLFQRTGQVPTSVPSAPAPVAPSRPVAIPVVTPEPTTSTPEPAEAIASPSASDLLTKTLLAVVSEKTGYPQDMLELDMSLDADLGIDSIKRVEILSALQEQFPELPTIEADDLGAIETLQDIVEKLGDLFSDDMISASPAAASASQNQIRDVLMDVVSEKTGYPVDMLELDMSLDADLGIDSIKRVEILSALQESMPELPTIEAEALGTLDTLQDVVIYLNENAPDAVDAGPSVGLPSATLQRLLLEIVSEKTGYPVEMLELEMSLDADLGIDSIKRVEILSALQERMPELPAVEAEDMGTLETLQDVLTYVETRDSGTVVVTETSAVDSLDEATESQMVDKIQRHVLDLVDVPANGARLNMPADAEWVVVGDGADALTMQLVQELGAREYDVHLFDAAATYEHVNGMIVVAPKSGLTDDGLKQLFFDAQKTSAALLETSKSEKTVFATVSRMDGCFGLSGEFDDRAILSGSLAGLAKTASHEWDGVVCRALDVAEAPPEQMADSIINTLLTDGPMEIGLGSGRTVSLLMNEESIADTDPIHLTRDDVVVISGGARGVTAEVACALAEAGSPTLVLLGRSAGPDVEESWLAGITDEAEVKNAIVANSNEKLTPKELQGAYDSIVRNCEASDAISRMKAAGSSVEYRAVDIRDSEKVVEVLSEIRETYGAISGLVHGAGVLADRLIADKTREQFDSVYDTKVLGFRSLLSALSNDPLKVMVLFSSSTGRFGRKGQVDYAMANETLNKWAHRESKKRSDCKVLSVNWGPWAGGMVTPALRKVFESEGIGLIGLQAGSDYLLRELNRPNVDSSEIVILGYSAEADMVEAEAIVPTQTIALDVEEYPFLKSHVIDGKAVLPVAMYVEWFAHAALHANPGLHYLGVDDVRIFKGIRIAEHETLELGVVAGKAEPRDAEHFVRVEMRSGSAWGDLHAQGIVRLGTKYDSENPSEVEGTLKEYTRSMEDVYENGLLFHGDDFQAIESVSGCSTDGIDVVAHPAPVPNQWIVKPQRRKWVGDPLVMDAAFQAMILWSFEQYDAGSLPVAFKRYTQYQSSWPKGNVIVRARVTKHSAHQATATIEFVHEAQGTLLARIEDYECVIDASLNAAFEHSQLSREESGS